MATSLERFVSLTTVTDRFFASHLCELLEETGISVVLEHVQVRGELLPADQTETGYRILVPLYRLQTARRIFSHAQDGALFRTEAASEEIPQQKFGT